jgi:acetyl esterase/lipase
MFKPLCLLASFAVFASAARAVDKPAAAPAAVEKPAPAAGAVVKPAPIPPTYANVSYGPHERNVLDFWRAEGDGPRPLLVNIHGGGWTSGDKSAVAGLPQRWLAKGVSVASINYRYSGIAILPAPVHDAARALQFLRSKAAEWNIRSERICLIGLSAGACTSMWLLCHDDLADPNSADPVLRQSTRVAGAVAGSGQTSLDPKELEAWLGPNVLQHRMVNLSVGEKTIAGALANYEKHQALYAEFSPITHVSADDPPLLMTYGDNVLLPSENSGHGIHHPVMGIKMKQKADSVKMECHLIIGAPRTTAAAKFNAEDAFIEAVLLQ